MPTDDVAAVKRAAPTHPIDDTLAVRWSPYAFADRPVEAATLASLFEAARWAPSSYNEQPWRYVVATREDPAAFARLLSCLVEGNQVWAKAAPVLALGVVVTRFRRNGKPNTAAEHDLGLASASLTFEATRRGLHVHQMIGIAPERARELYDMPEDAKPLTALAIGHAGDPAGLPDGLRDRDLNARTREPLAAFVFGARFGEAAKL
jgi:nitroreductase